MTIFKLKKTLKVMSLLLIAGYLKGAAAFAEVAN